MSLACKAGSLKPQTFTRHSGIHAKALSVRGVIIEALESGRGSEGQQRHQPAQRCRRR